MFVALHPDWYVPEEVPHEFWVENSLVVDVENFKDHIALLVKTSKYNTEHKWEPFIMVDPLISVLVHEVNDPSTKNPLQPKVLSDKPQRQILTATLLEH